MTQNLTGRLLIASPHLSDGNFLRSVIFMIRDDVEGAFGLTINRPTQRRFRDLVDSSSANGKMREDDYIFRGGPVEGPLLALHDLAGVGEPCIALPMDLINKIEDGSLFGESLSGSKITMHDAPEHGHPAEPWGSMSMEFANPPAWVTGDDDHLRILLRRPDANVRYISSYAGWGPGQLQQELEMGGWLSHDADPEILFGCSDEIWEKAVQMCGSEILAEMAPGLSFGDPNLN